MPRLLAAQKKRAHVPTRPLVSVPSAAGEVDLYADAASQRRLFCTAPWGSREIQISADRLEAVLVHYERVPRSRPTAVDLAKALASVGLVSGLRPRPLRALAAGLPRQAQRGLVLARGDSPANAFDWLAGPVPFSGDFSALDDLLSGRRDPAQIAGFPAVLSVFPGTRIARLRSPGSVEQGRDVFGRPIQAPPPPHPGQNVVYCPRRRLFSATLYGYLIFKCNVLSVRPPFWVAPDGMRATYVGLPSKKPSQPPQPAALHASLHHKGVLGGILPGAIDRICRPAATPDRLQLIEVARGRPAEDGRPARFAPLFRTALAPGRLRPDGSIDLREREKIQTVRRGDLLAIGHPPLPGKDGFNVYASPLPARAGPDLEWISGAGVLALRGPETRYYAARDGAVHWDRGVLDVCPLVVIQGDIDYHTGHIRTSHDLLVRGSLKTGFHARAGGNVWIEGCIEPGARVQAGGDVFVGGGILGARTRLQAKGGLKAAFVHQARVVADGDMEISQHIHHASVLCGGFLRVCGQGRRLGGIVGGRVGATQGIEVPLAGSPTGAPTVLALLPPLELHRRIQRLHKNQAPRAHPGRERLARACPGPSSKRAHRRLESLEKDRRAHFARARIRFSRQLYAGTSLLIGSARLHLREDRKGCTARLEKNRVSLGGRAGT